MATTLIESTVIATFRPQLEGELLLHGDTGYDSARRVWNGMVDRSPGCIVRCAGVADVIAAVNFARENRLDVAVRGGGHNAAGLAMCDGGIVIDLSAMRGIRVDPARKTVHAQGGVTWGDFDRDTQAFGLAATGGAVSTTGIAGLTLGGGIGWLMRKFGLACDNLISADIVTADGEMLVASETENSELFWGLRGGGGNFGIVTSFEFRLHPLDQVLGGMLVFPQQQAKEVLRTYLDVTSAAPDELTVFAGLMTSPDGVPIVGVPLCHCGTIADGEALIRPLRDLGPVADQVGPMPYTALQSMLDPAFPSGLQVYWRSDFLSRLDDEVMDVLIDQVSRIPSPLSAVLIEQMGGAVRRVGANDTAFNHRDAAYNLAIISRWVDVSDAERQIAWTRELHDAIRPFTTGGVYVNYLGYGESVDRVREAYGPEKYQRLVALKDKYDPTNFFRQNQNIAPSV